MQLFEFVKLLSHVRLVCVQRDIYSSPNLTVVKFCRAGAARKADFLPTFPATEPTVRG